MGVRTGYEGYAAAIYRRFEGVHIYPRDYLGAEDSHFFY